MSLRALESSGAVSHLDSLIKSRELLGHRDYAVSLGLQCKFEYEKLMRDYTRYQTESLSNTNEKCGHYSLNPK